MIPFLAWRNIKRSKQRTIITTVLSTFTTFLFIFFMSIQNGSYAKMFKDAVEVYPGYIHVQHTKYKDEPNFEHLIFNEKALVSKLQSYDDVDTVTSRFEGFGLFASDENAFAGMFIGVEPQNEPKVSTVYKGIRKGRYLLSTDTHGIIIGQGLATKLNVDINDTFSVIATASDYSTAADNLKVVGIFKTGLADFDNGAVFMNKPYYDEVMQTQNIASTLVVLPRNPDSSLALSKTLQNDLKEVHVEDWHTYMKGFINAMALDKVSGRLMLWVFVVLIFFVVMIYAFITIHSRINEFGIMRSIGTSQGQIVGLLFLEVIFLATFSAFLGGAMGGGLAYYFELNPIMLPSMQDAYQQFGIIEATLPAKFSWETTLWGMGYVFVLNLISVLLPVWQIIRIKPIDAVHHI